MTMKTSKSIHHRYQKMLLNLWGFAMSPLMIRDGVSISPHPSPVHHTVYMMCLIICQGSSLIGGGKRGHFTYVSSLFCQF
jgi:hypothetical protein